MTKHLTILIFFLSISPTNFGQTDSLVKNQKNKPFIEEIDSSLIAVLQIDTVKQLKLTKNDSIFDPNNSNFLTAIATILLVLVGLIQIYVLFSQKKQTRIALTEQYRQLWYSLKKYWGNVVFIGREGGEYYQVLDELSINAIRTEISKYRLDTPSIWALESIQKVCGTLGEVSTRVLQGHLKIADIYPIFGTQFLRQTRPLRILLDPTYENNSYQSDKTTKEHKLIRNEIQDWLLYHDGLRRRCLILIDLLWTEATRLEDLPPDEMKNAADTKKKTGNLNRKRVFKETIKLNGPIQILLAFRFSRFLRKAEYCSLLNCSGINKKRLDELNVKWTKQILRTK